MQPRPAAAAGAGTSAAGASWRSSLAGPLAGCRRHARQRATCDVLRPAATGSRHAGNGAATNAGAGATDAWGRSEPQQPHSQQASQQPATHGQAQRFVNQQVADAAPTQQQRLLRQLVEAQQALRRQQAAAQQEQAARQQAAWQAHAQHWAAAAAAPASGAAGAPFTTATSPAFAHAGTSGPGDSAPRFSSSAATHAHHALSHHHQQRQQHQQRSTLPRQHHRHYDVPVDVDDCWGRRTPGVAGGAGAGHSSSSRSSSGGGRASGSSDSAGGGRRSEQAWWQEFARETSGGFQYRSYRSTQQQQQQHEQRQQQQQQRQQQQQQQQAGRASQSAGAATGSGAGVAAGPEPDVRAELAALLAQSGGDLLRFVAALGIPFESGTDRRSALRNARAAALLRLHPDKLLQTSARQQALGAHATQMVNELWRARR